MQNRKTILFFVLGTLTGGLLVTMTIVNVSLPFLHTKSEKFKDVSIDSLRTALLSEKLNSGLSDARLKIATNDFIDESEKSEMMEKVFGIEQKIIAKARNYNELGIVIKNIMITSPNFKYIPSIIPLKPGTFKRLSSGYGWRKHPVLGKDKLHTGIDISAIQGTYVYAPADGEVIAVDPYWTKSGYGNRIIINHKFGFQTLYGHLSEFLVKKGDQVKVGDIIGRVGSTGISTGPHLHYEIIKNGEKINPFEFTLITMRKLKMEDQL